MWFIASYRELKLFLVRKQSRLNVLQIEQVTKNKLKGEENGQDYS